MLFQILALPLLALVANVATLSPVVDLPKQGQVQGLVSTSRNGKEYYSYWGIPYANPPRRFEPPEPATIKWAGIRNTTAPGSACVQIPMTLPLPDPANPLVIGSEDCLFMNVFTTQVGKAKKGIAGWFGNLFGKGNSLKPVIVYIYGGSFMAGSSRSFGADFLMDESVVLVTFNYRVSMLGFLNLGYLNNSSSNEVRARGNMGMKDQIEALKWVQENIHLFGGDKSKVTIYGESSGAASVHYHIISPVSAGLFSRAISSSGSALNGWGLPSRDPNHIAQELANGLNCTSNDGQLLLSCLMAKNASELMAQSYSSVKAPWSLDPSTPFGISIETLGSPSMFLGEHPEHLLKAGKFSKIPWMAGMNRNEGILINSGLVLSDSTLTAQLNSNWSANAPITLELIGLIRESNMEAAVAEIRNFYFASGEISLANEVALEQLYSDRNFYHGIRSSVLQHASQAHAYPYIFDYADGQNVLGFTMPAGSKQGSMVLHGDDLRYTFSGNTFGVTLNASNIGDVEFSKKWVKLIVEFANTGVANGHILGEAKGWPAASTFAAGLKLFHVDSNGSLQDETFTTRMDFWDALLKKYGY